MATGLLLALVILPWPLGDLLDGPAVQMLMPISEPLAHLSATVRPPRRAVPGDAEEIDQLLVELNTRDERIFYLERQVDLLQHQLSELTSLYQEDPDVVYLPVRRGTGGTSAGRANAFQVNAGTRQGVTRETVAITPYRQLIGRVQRVDTLTASIIPIIHPETVLSVRIEAGADGLQDDEPGSLKADEQGRLSGLFDSGIMFPPGSVVRLCDDDVWGHSNTGLIVGFVEYCEPYPQHSLHQLVSVKPTIDIMRLSDMLLKIPQRRPDVPPSDGGGGP
ncbi:MAG: hypothetical protein HND57_07980 [Planctomycetes bacterium]|nr:hypothetical protein [Planctomycetota bacterium]